MELHQLRYLVALAEELHFTRAAARANIAQPALSRQIRKLEEELGVPLVDRTTRQVRLTSAGTEFAERARRVLQELDDARAVIGGDRQLLTGRLSIGVTATPGPLDSSAVLGRFHAAHPGIELAFREGLSVDLAEQLRRDELDLAFITNIDAAKRHQLELQMVAEEPLHLIVAADHRLADREAVSFRSLMRERFVAFPRGATIRRAVEEAAGRAGFAPHVAFESLDVSRARALVAQCLGVAVLPRSDATSPGPAVVALPFREGGLTHQVFVAWRARRRLAPSAKAFLEVTMATIAANGMPAHQGRAEGD